MRKIAHIVNPVVVDQASDLYVAQPITFETMKTAKKFAAGEVAVDLLTAQFPEDRALVPDGFHLTPNLERSVLDFGVFQKKRKLPLLVDILDRLYAATDAEYCIYTNVDIAVQPHFYVAVNALIEKGYDAFVINRRTVEAVYSSPAEIPLMYAEVGEKHPGYDCFVFRRDVYPNYQLDRVCLGILWIDDILIWNLVCRAQNFSVFRKLHLTFHLGDSQTWLKQKYSDYYAHNREAARRALAVLERTHGPLQEIDGFAQNALGVEYAKQLLREEESAETQLKVMKRRLKKRQEMQRMKNGEGAGEMKNAEERQ
ncbi:hypothetical protein HUU05_00870 [candidate division KSB1 bacterium]|nr:hypothetical protein [candidate division KSB1 bacterium]